MSDYAVCVCFKRGAPIIECFKEERKARDYYTDALLKYPNANVEFIKPKI